MSSLVHPLDENLGLMQYFESNLSVTSDKYGIEQAKPNPYAYNYAFARTSEELDSGLRKADVYVLEDTVGGALAGLAAGMNVILVSSQKNWSKTYLNVLNRVRKMQDDNRKLSKENKADRLIEAEGNFIDDYGNVPRIYVMVNNYDDNPDMQGLSQLRLLPYLCD
jgi:beta-phosphoglucomutase-like phosphatase (HAD superfamily)